MPAIKNQKTISVTDTEYMTAQETALFLQCAKDIADTLDYKLRRSRDLVERSKLDRHIKVVNKMIEDFYSSKNLRDRKSVV